MGARDYLAGHGDNAHNPASECWLAGAPDHLFPQSFAKAIDQYAVLRVRCYGRLSGRAALPDA